MDDMEEAHHVSKEQTIPKEHTPTVTTTALLATAQDKIDQHQTRESNQDPVPHTPPPVYQAHDTQASSGAQRDASPAIAPESGRVITESSAPVVQNDQGSFADSSNDPAFANYSNDEYQLVFEHLAEEQHLEAEVS